MIRINLSFEKLKVGWGNVSKNHLRRTASGKGCKMTILAMALIFSFLSVPAAGAMEKRYDEVEAELPLSNWWIDSVYPAENLAKLENSGQGGSSGTPGLTNQDYWPAPGENWGDTPAVLMFTVSPSSPRLYWIVGTADYYTGSGWAKTTGSIQTDSFPENTDNWQYQFSVSFNTISSKFSVPIPQYETGLSDLVFDPEPTRKSLFVDRTAGIYGIEIPGLVRTTGVSYKAGYTPVEINPSLIDMSKIPENIRNLYLQLPDNMPSEVRSLADNLKNSSLSTMDQILADVAYLKNNFAYDVAALTGLLSTPGRTDNFEENGDAAAVINSATQILAGKGLGYLGGSDYNDYFKISVSAGSKLTATLTSPSGANFNLYLLNSGGQQISVSLNSGSTDSVSTTPSSSADYYLRVSRAYGSGVYTLEVSVADGSSPYSVGNDWVLTFMTRGKGICMDFSTALAVLLRMQGIPARVNFGFKPGTSIDDKTLYFSTGGHSETEAYLYPYGWVRFDATPAIPVSSSGSGTDSDGDGIPDSWEQQYGLNTNLLDSGQDYDGDGRTNLQEYQDSTDPTDPGSNSGGSSVDNPAITENQTQIPPQQTTLTSTSIALTLSPENSTRLSNPNVSFSMTLQTASGPLPSKLVQLHDGLTGQLFSILTTDSSGSAYTLKSYGVSDKLGEHYITASFVGDGTYAPSSSSKVFLLYSPTTISLSIPSKSVKRGGSLSFEGELKDDLGAGVSGAGITVLIDGQAVQGGSVTTGSDGKYNGAVMIGNDLETRYHTIQTKFDSSDKKYLSSQSASQSFEVLASAEQITPIENTHVSGDQDNSSTIVTVQDDQTILLLGAAVAAAVVAAFVIFKLRPRGEPEQVEDVLKLPSVVDLRKLLDGYRNSEKYREGITAAYQEFAKALLASGTYMVKEDQTARELSLALSSKVHSFASGAFNQFIKIYDKAMFTDRPISKSEFDSAAENYLAAIKSAKVGEN